MHIPKISFPLKQFFSGVQAYSSPVKKYPDMHFIHFSESISTSLQKLIEEHILFSAK